MSEHHWQGRDICQQDLGEMVTSRPANQHIGCPSSGQGLPHTGDGFGPEKLLWEVWHICVRVNVYTWLDLQEEIVQELLLSLVLGTEEVCVCLLGLRQHLGPRTHYRF